MSIVPDSDPREYRPPPPHEFKPVGLKLYKPKRNTFDRGLVLREPEGEDAATFWRGVGGIREINRVKRLMPIFGAHPTSQTPRARAVPTATGGEGAEVIGGASLEELHQLPEQVIYYSSRGHRRSVDIPSPENVELALAPSVQQVSREYVESCFRCLSGMSALIRQKSMDDESKSMVIERQSMMIKDLEARLLVNQDQRVASAGHSASTMGRGSGDDDRDKEDNEEEDDEEDNVGSEDEEEGEEESEEEDREIASREASPSGPSSKKPRR
ncbi:hypothetical protein RHSIM_Rhsim12G0011000 [Rhododendron simsii]|uniref:Uncharacterized protein n=1 Tax=Rhododendron simsii TaxID=118357 RepID=A0A834G6Z6_RHOSS|nr:hypothetical protein RHSIM_Rhsim12G0011000 [Rhododendron simsii]